MWATYLTQVALFDPIGGVRSGCGKGGSLQMVEVVDHGRTETAMSMETKLR